MHSGQLIDGTGSTNIKWGKDSLFNKLHLENWAATCKRIKLGHYLTPYTKINFKWIKDLNVRPETMKLFKEITGGKLLDISLDNDFFYLTPNQRQQKQINNWNYIKVESFCTAEEIINIMKRHQTK